MRDIRCFVAVDLPVSMLEDIRGIQEKIAMEGLRLVRPELVHITLKFLGEVPEEKIERIVQALLEVKVMPFTAHVAGMGAFPARSMRVVWLGLKGNFEELYHEIESSLSPLGFEREKRGFNPHVTLGRVKRPGSDINRQLGQKITEFADIDLGDFNVDHFILKKSTLTRGGPIYDDLAEFHLRNQKQSVS